MKMFLSVVFSFCCCFLFNYVGSESPPETAPFQFPQLPLMDDHLLEAYDGEHFFDLTTYTNGTFRLPTLLVLYKMSCKTKAQSLLLLDIGHYGWVPFSTHWNYVTHDYESWKKSAWFRFSATQDLATLYDITLCPTALFWERGENPTGKPAKWTEQSRMSFSNWISERLVRSVTLINDLNHDVEFWGTGGGHNVVRVKPAGKKNVKLYAAWQFPVIARQPRSCRILQAWHVTRNEEIHLTRNDEFSYSDWFDVTKRKQEQELKEARLWHHLLKNQHTSVRQRPQEANNVSQKGYTVKQIPATVHQDLLSLYNKTPRGDIIDLGKFDPILNSEDRTIRQSPLSEEDGEMVARRLQPLVEEWCNCELIPKGTYFLRTYSRGSRVRLHVDNYKNVDAYVCALVQVLQEMNGAPEWEFNLIGLDGEWHNLVLLPGDMLLLENTVVPHGRLRPLEGDAYVSSFLCYSINPSQAVSSTKYKDEF